MKKFKVLDFDYGCGGFTKGLEDTGFFEVIYNGSINKKNQYCYNNTHINDFSSLDIIPKNFDLAVFTPYVGNKLINGNFSKIKMKNINNFFAFITLRDVKNLIFITRREVLPLLHQNKSVFYTSDGFPTTDVISCFLSKMNFNIYNFVLDGAGFGLPQHQFYNIYWASKDIKDNILIKEGFGPFKRPYRKVKHLLKGIDDNTNLSWHNPDYSKKFECSLIKKGQDASNNDKISQNSGFYRLDDNSIASNLSYDFYNFSSKGPSIHPIYDRPLTIREGARLFGLTDDFKWDYNLKRNEVGMMIYNSFPPFISKLLGQRINKLFRNIE